MPRYEITEFVPAGGKSLYKSELILLYTLIKNIALSRS
jgi:hypothetical protein